MNLPLESLPTVGRKKEQQVLDHLLHSNRAELLALVGRRRVGKTHLIRTFFQSKSVFYFELTGVKDGKLSEQLRYFATAYAETFGETIPLPASWNEALTLLRHRLESLDRNQKIVLFFDELPWLASRRSGFLQALDHLWNRYLSQWPHVIVVVCGSAAAWMLRHIVHNRAGFYGRLTAEIRLLPFTLGEVEAFLQSRHIELDRGQLVHLYLAMGGIPQYLMGVERGESAAQAIQRLCFTRNGPLSREFHTLYASLFDHASRHIDVMVALARRRQGLTQTELLNEIGFHSGGSFSSLIEELQEAGFLLQVPQLGKKKRERKMRLIDEYSLFYLEWIQKAVEQDMGFFQSNDWLRQQSAPSYRAWSGFAFEGVCLKHLPQIAEALGIGVVVKGASGWWDRDPSQGGAQIDLVIDRHDGCINLCEIKFSMDPLRLTTAQANELNHKKERFRQVTGTRKALITTLITSYGAEINGPYTNSVDNQLTMDVLFKECLIYP